MMSPTCKCLGVFVLAVILVPSRGWGEPQNELPRNSRVTQILLGDERNDGNDAKDPPKSAGGIVVKEFFRFDKDPMQSDLVNKLVGQPPMIRLVPPSAEEIPDRVDPASDDSDADKRYSDDDLKPIKTVSTDIHPSEGELPPDHAAPKFAAHGVVSQTSNASRYWETVEFNWEAPMLAHRQLYFEDENLERYGYTVGLLQPALSTVHFASRVVSLPYWRGASQPHKLQYAFGYYRPGSCHAPYYLHRPPVSLRGAAEAAATAVGLIFLLP